MSDVNSRVLAALDRLANGTAGALDLSTVRAFVQVAMLRQEVREQEPTADCGELAYRICDRLAREAPKGVWPGLSREDAVGVIQRVLWGNSLAWEQGTVAALRDVLRESEAKCGALEAEVERLRDAFSSVAVEQRNELTVLRAAIERSGFVLKGNRLERVGRGNLAERADDLGRALDDLVRDRCNGNSVVLRLSNYLSERGMK